MNESMKIPNCEIKNLKNETGNLVLTSYTVFPGIKLVYSDVHMQETKHFMSSDEADDDIIFEINHCKNGRIECSCGDSFYYLSPGDLSIHKRSAVGNNAYFPYSNYQGVTLLINIKTAPKCLSCFLDDVNVQPSALMAKFCDKNNFFVARSNSHLEHIFSELYSIPKEVQKGYFKIKVLEILLFLSCLDPNGQEKKMYTAAQVSLVKRVCKFLIAHMDERITIEQLSSVFHISPTQLKNCFKGVYGMSVYRFIRTQKMEDAADMLRNTDKSILEIANLHGYDNGSKFASAFQDVMGMTPNKYRHSIEINE